MKSSMLSRSRKSMNALGYSIHKIKENAIFTLTLKYGVGTHEMPQLQYAVDLMNNAGIMGAYEPQGVKAGVQCPRRSL